MQRWLPVHGSGITALIALPLVAVMAIRAHRAEGFEPLPESMSLKPTSTLDAQIPPQDGAPSQAMELHRVLVDIVDQGVLTDSRSRQADPSRAKRALWAPSNRSKIPAVSPFHKWAVPKEGPTQTETDSAGASSTNASPSMTTQRVARHSHRQLARATSSRTKAVTTKKKKAAPTNPSTEAPRQSKTTKLEPPATKNYPLPHADPSSQTIRPTPSNLPPLTSGQQRLRSKVRRVLAHYYNRPLNTRDRGPWEMMHGMLAYEVHSKVLRNGPRGEPITTVGWLCFNQTCKRRTLMFVDKEGELQVRVGPALQGHRGQLMAMLAQSRVKREYPMRVDGQDYTVNDLIEMEKKTCYPRTELTFKLIGLMHYLDSDAQWVNDQGLAWNIPKLINEELRQPVRGAACGGTHRLTGLTLAYKKRQQRGEPIDGEYLRAKKFVTRYQQYAYRLQNSDGSFSTEWFRGSGRDESIDRRMKTTGHLLEWLLYAASEKDLKSRQTTKAVNYLANLMYNNRYKDWEIGPLGHTIHGLLVYDRLVFSPHDKPDKLPVAGKSKSVAARTKR